MGIVKREPKRICSATTSAGNPCKAQAVTADGLCAAHGGLVDMQAIGRRGGERRGKAEQLERLTDREQAMAALRRALDGGNKAAMVAAAKALIEHDLTPQAGPVSVEDARAELAARLDKIAEHRARAIAEGKAELCPTCGASMQADRESMVRAGSGTVQRAAGPGG
jgi:hypothetical protein